MASYTNSVSYFLKLHIIINDEERHFFSKKFKFFSLFCKKKSAIIADSTRFTTETRYLRGKRESGEREPTACFV